MPALSLLLDNRPPEVLKVALGYPLPLFDYLPPPNQEIETIEIGSRVYVPFGKKHTMGIVVDKGLSDLKVKQLKPALNLPDTFPLFSKEMLAWLKNAADYYHYPLSEALFTGLPNLLKKNLPLCELVSAPKRRASKIADLHKDNLETPLVLTSEQKHAVEQITKNLNQFSCHLLKGITGSGKTEVYLQTIEACANTQVLILIPEIALAPQTCQRVINRFGEKATIYHSQLTPSQKLKAWYDIFSGQKQIVVGTRSALFLPFKNLGMMIVDEEHDPSFKQQEGFLFSARDMAIWRAKLAKIPIVLGSATPSLETLQNCKLNRFSTLLLTKRPNDALLPKVQIIDTNIEKLQQGLSGTLITALKQNLLANQQSLLFINRRGYAPTVMCVACFWQAKCVQCQGRLTYHLQYNRLYCHTCEARQAVPSQCPCCQSAQIKPIGLGTERIEAGLENLFPTANIARIDSDSITTPKKLKIALDKINCGESQILIGTQLLAKGHHFPNVTLVGIIHMDSGLYSADFRATERTAQLITQVSGRAGRAQQPGTVFLQSALPNHPLLQAILSGGYDAFADYILKERQQSQLPPFSHLAIIRAKSSSQKQMMTTLSNMKTRLKSQPKVKLFGPIIPNMDRQNELYQAQLWVLAQKRSELQGALLAISDFKSSHTVKWAIDVDPLSTY